MNKKLKDAVDTLVAALSEDKSEGSYYYSWQANIAIAFQDVVNNEFCKDGEINMTKVELHAVSNIAARNFLDTLILCKPEPPTENGYVKGGDNE